jgi:hypothetical protein
MVSTSLACLRVIIYRGCYGYSIQRISDMGSALSSGRLLLIRCTFLTNSILFHTESSVINFVPEESRLLRFDAVFLL